MAYEKQIWRNLPDQTTPLSAQRLSKMETQYDEAAALIDTKVAPLATREYVDASISTVESDSGPDSDTVAVEFDINRMSAPVGARLTIPTHVTPAGGQATHPSVVLLSEPLSGYPYWMAVTPYPSGNDAHEDPNILASKDGVTWRVPAGLTNPLDDAPGSPQYNSDTDLVWAQGKLWCFWRYLDTNDAETGERIYVRSSSDGITWGPKELVYQSAIATRRLVSPSLLFEGGRWVMYAVDIAGTGANKFVRLETSGVLPYAGQWSTPVTCSLSLPSGRTAWHVEVRRIGGRLYGLMNDCVTGQSGVDGDIYLITTNNDTTWTRGSQVLIPRSGPDHSSLYRATFIPEVNNGDLGLRIWYSAWVPGSPAVWNVFRTLATIPPAVTPTPSTIQSGKLSVTGPLPASGGFLSQSVTFPTPYSSPPSVVAITESGRVNVAVTSVTTTGFTLGFNNWTSAVTWNNSPGTAYWIAY